MQEEVKHYKVKSLPTQLRPNSVYYVKATSQSAVKTYITDQGGIPFPLIDLASLNITSIVNSVTGTGVTGSSNNPVVNISTFKSSQLGNLIELSSLDGKLFVKPITSPDGSIDITSTATSLELQLGASLQTQIQNALQPGDNISELTNDVGYITLADLPFSAITATAWTPNHTIATGNPYLAGTIVYYLGHVFQANFNNDSIVPAIGGNLYWTDLGVGYLIDQEQTDWLAVSGSAFIKNKPTNVSSFVNDAGYLTQQSVLEFANLAAFPPVGASNTIYIALDTDIAYYWDGTSYVTVTSSTSGISGFGIVNRLAKFTPNGSTIGSSKIVESIGGVTTINWSARPLIGGNTILSIQRNQAQIDFILGNPGFNQPAIMVSDNQIDGFEIWSKGELAFKTGSTYANEGIRIFSTGKLKFTQTPDAGTTSDFLLMRDTSGNVKQIAYPTIPAGGLPPGGTAGQILTKVDAIDYNATWQDNYADWTSVVKHIVKNDGTSLITKGTPVYSTGADGTNILVGKASNTSEATSSKTMGLMQSDITTTGGTQTGFVITEGLLGGLNTAGTTAGDPVWLGAGGTLLYGLINKPYAPNHLVFIGIVTKVSAGNGEIFVKIQNGFELKEIHDVDLITNSPSNGDLLVYNETKSLWENQSEEFKLRQEVRVLSSDFIGTVAAANTPFTFSSYNTGSNTVTTYLNGINPGVTRISSSATPNSGGVFSSNALAAGAIAPTPGQQMDFVFRTPNTIIGAGSTIRAGFMVAANTATDATHGFYMEIVDNQLYGKTAASSVRSTTATTYSISNGGIWFHVRVLYKATNLIEYSLYNMSGTLLWSDTLTTNIPIAFLSCNILAFSSSTNTTNTEMISLDYVAFTLPTSTRGALN